jgi:hypothetical protein
MIVYSFFYLICKILIEIVKWILCKFNIIKIVFSIIKWTTTVHVLESFYLPQFIFRIWCRHTILDVIFLWLNCYFSFSYLFVYLSMDNIWIMCVYLLSRCIHIYESLISMIHVCLLTSIRIMFYFKMTTQVQRYGAVWSKFTVKIPIAVLIDSWVI